MIYIFLGLFISAVISVIIIDILNRLYKYKLIKYLPIFMATWLTILSIININNDNWGFKKMYYVISSIIWIEIVITMLITSIMIDLKSVKNNKKINYNTYN